MGWLRHLVAVAVAATFVYAAVEKVLDPANFALQLKYYKLFPLWSLHLVALLVPWWELTAGLALLVPKLRKGAALVLLFLILGFLVSVSQALARGLDIECGCFGSGSAKLGWMTLALDVALLAAVTWLLVSPGQKDDRSLQTQAVPA